MSSPFITLIESRVLTLVSSQNSKKCLFTSLSALGEAAEMTGHAALFKTDGLAAFRALFAHEAGADIASFR